MFARAYDSAIRPIHVGRRLVGALDDAIGGADGDPGTRWEVALHPTDRGAFDEVARHLERELAEALTQHAERRGLRPERPFEVRLVEDPGLAEGDFAVRPADAPVVAPDREPTGDPARTAVVPPVRPVVARLVAADGTLHVLEGDRVRVGRQATCGVVLQDPNVSREHAQLRRGPSGWTVLDLGSTNGTRINGRGASGEQLLASGDEIAFGSVTVRFEIA